MTLNIDETLQKGRCASGRGHNMRTTIDVDRYLLDKVVEMTGEASKIKAENRALEEYVRRMRIEHLLSLLGKLDLDLDDWYELRHMER